MKYPRHFHRRSRSVGIYITPTECIPSVYSKRETFFFWRARTVGKRVFFITDRYSDGMWNHRQKVFRREDSVGNIVGKYFTDERSVTHRRNISVGKTVKSCSAEPAPPHCLLFTNPPSEQPLPSAALITSGSSPPASIFWPPH